MLTRQPGALGHIDCRNLHPNLIAGDPTRYALVIVIDSGTRLAWAELVHERTSLIVTCSALMSILELGLRYRLQFAEVLTDRGAEFAEPTRPATHPFERLLLELGITHRYIQPPRWQANAKMARFWQTLNADLIGRSKFVSLAAFSDRLGALPALLQRRSPTPGVAAENPDATERRMPTTVGPPAAMTEGATLSSPVPLSHPREHGLPASLPLPLSLSFPLPLGRTWGKGALGVSSAFCALRSIF